MFVFNWGKKGNGILGNMSYFKEEFLPVEQVGDEHPQCGSPQALEEPLPVAPLVVHLPAEWEVETQERVANIHKDGVHPWGGEQERQALVVVKQDSSVLKKNISVFQPWSYSSCVLRTEKICMFGQAEWISKRFWNTFHFDENPFQCKTKSYQISESRSLCRQLKLLFIYFSYIYNLHDLGKLCVNMTWRFTKWFWHLFAPINQNPPNSRIYMMNLQASRKPLLLNITWVYERLSAPPALDVSDKVHASQQQEGKTAHACHIGQRPGETDHQRCFTTTPAQYFYIWASLKCL